MYFLVFVLSCFASSVLADDYFHSLYMDSNKNYHLSWKVNNSHIEFHTKVKALGYVALGLSMDGSLKNADVFLAGVSNGKSYSSNYYGNADGKLSLQATSEWHLVYFKESDMETTLTFYRKLSGPNMKINITESTIRVLWGFGTTDNVNDNFQPDGVRSQLLLQEYLPDPVRPDDAFEIEFRMNNTLIPKSKTTYWCKSFAAPPLDGQVHGIEVSAYIQKGNKPFVHHILLYGCDKSTSVQNTMEYDGRCYVPNMPPEWKACQTLLHGWAVGGSKFVLPGHAGIPIGGEDDPKYYLLEMHYDNPQKKEGVRDSSGIKIIATKTLRQYEVGTLTVGSFLGEHPEIIPPYAKEFSLNGYCKTCGFMIKRERNVQWNEEGVKMIAVVLHGHLAARKIRLYHYRDGKQLPFIAHDENYDFNYQEGRVIKNGITLLKGDILQLECVYDTTQRSKITYGGYGTEDEMCQAFISIYPRIELQKCLSDTEYNISLISEEPSYYINNQDAIKKVELAVNGVEPKVGFTQYCVSRNNYIIFMNRSLPLIKPEDTSTINIKSSAANFFMKNGIIFILIFYWLI